MAVTPLPTANRPGLSALSYRIGTHSAFLASMIARLSSAEFPALAKLATREPSDPSLALLDSWATVADVLTFYQERIANEGYLRTAIERRSVLELGRLVGYAPRPGVAASVYLAYDVDPHFPGEAIIPAGSRCQSLPGAGEVAEPFETSEDFKARASWNNLRPRMDRHQDVVGVTPGDLYPAIYLKGIATGLRPNDPLLVQSGQLDPLLHRVLAVTTDAAADRTKVLLQAVPKPTKNTNAGIAFAQLKLPASLPPASSSALMRSFDEQFGGSVNKAPLRELEAGEDSFALVNEIFPAVRETLTAAAGNLVLDQPTLRVYALRVRASLFGHNAIKEPKYEPSARPPNPPPPPPPPRPPGPFFLEAALAPAAVRLPGTPLPQAEWDEWVPNEDDGKTLYLDANYNEVMAGTWVAITGLTGKAEIREVKTVEAISRTAYGQSGKTTKLTFEKDLPSWPPPSNIAGLRKVLVLTQAEELPLALAPVTEGICGVDAESIELDGFYDGLKPGRWVIVSGEREVAGTSGVRHSELSMIGSVWHRKSFGLLHTYIKLAAPLAYCFHRASVRIYGNVVKATHGETRNEILGSGDGSRAFQQFTLKQAPLTFVSAPNAAGIDSTLKIYVNDVRWHEAQALNGLAPIDRRFVSKIDDDAQTTAVFGNGWEGARLPTGSENIRAVYRTGIGKGGNVRAGQLSLLVSRPPGAKDVINPLPASGGASRETRDQARKNVPLAVKALDRLVSVQDYEDFARVFAGIGKARAAELPDGQRQIVHLTIAGADDIPILKSSDLYRNLTSALRRLGDPYQPFRVELRDLKLLVITANIRIGADYLWAKVEQKVRAALLDTFSFDRRELGQDALLSEAIAAMQKVPGVEYVDVDKFGGIASRAITLPDPNLVVQEVAKITFAQHRVLAEVAEWNGKLLPAELVYLSPQVPGTLILTEVPR